MDKIYVLDSGGQYAHLIANRIRRLKVFSEIRPNDIDPKEISDAKGIILSGGPQSVYEDGAPQVDKRIFGLGVPVLGICYGHHLIAHNLGGKVDECEVKEYGLTEIYGEILDSKILEGLNRKEIVWMSHGTEVTKLPHNFKTYYRTKNCYNAVIADPQKRIYGVQFHPEVTHTKCGVKILDNFLKICGVRRDWVISHFIDEEREKIIEQTKDKKVFLLTSGGVDSTVTFLVLSEILGLDRVYGLFVDTGLMRKDEEREVEKNMQDLGFTNFHIAYKGKEFLKALEGVFEPEEKRKIIGRLFLDIQKEYSDKLNLNPKEWVIGQGTIYPDTIESGGSKHASKIKTHHNRVSEIEDLIKKGVIIEPIKDLYKDEVREVGISLGLKKELVWRHPFPGPGLGVRILCSKEPDTLHNASEIEGGIKSDLGIENTVLNIKSVGVQGDARTYRHPVALFFEDTPSWDNLEELSTEITNNFYDINRVLLCLSHPVKPKKIRVYNKYLTHDRVEVLQEIDYIVMKNIKAAGLIRDIWQFPVVLLPIGLDNKESVVLRPVCSMEAMTANFYKIDWKLLDKIKNEIMDTGKISMLFFDLTNKPPSTIEWE